MFLLLGITDIPGGHQSDLERVPPAATVDVPPSSVIVQECQTSSYPVFDSTCPFNLPSSERAF